MDDFINFLLQKVYQSKPIPAQIIKNAFLATVNDVRYHFADATVESVKNSIQSNSNELAIFLFRLGNELHKNKIENLKPQIHWLLKELCACEIYFNNEIAEGFYIVHGEGTVIGSRNIIGKGFKIHQGCTIGHKKNGGGNGNIIKDDVIMYCNSSIIGELVIEENVVIGAHVMITKNIKQNLIITSQNTVQSRALKAKLK